MGQETKAFTAFKRPFVFDLLLGHVLQVDCAGSRLMRFDEFLFSWRPLVHPL